MKADYLYKTEPYDHQKKCFELSRDMEYYALLLEPGCGKSKIIIDTAAWLYNKGKITAVVILAPNGVHRKWVIKEIPEHLPEHIPYMCYVVDSRIIKTKKGSQCFQELLDFKGLRFLACSFSMTTVKKSFRILDYFLKSAKVLFVADESTYIKNPKSKRTKAVLKLAGNADYRRILTGTPVANGPLDIYTQFSFLHNNILSFNDYYTFSRYYGEWVQTFIGNHSFYRLKKYKNIPELHEKIKDYSFRITKNECLDLPPRSFEEYPVEMTPAQEKMYLELKDTLCLELDQGDIVISMALTRMMRLQQITSGYLPTTAFVSAVDTGNDSSYIDVCKGKNPKMEAVFNICRAVQDSTGGKIVIWGRFVPELIEVAKMLRDKFGTGTVVEYHGRVAPEIKLNNPYRFQEEDDIKFFVGQSQGGIGIDLYAASTVIYYSNSFSSIVREQSQDRVYRIGQTNKVTVYDLIVPDTIDSVIAHRLKHKQALAEKITLDKIRQMLS